MIQTTIDGRRFPSPQEAASRDELSVSTLAGRRARGLGPNYCRCGSRARHEATELESRAVGRRSGGAVDE